MPAATQRSQNTEKISVSGVPARPACVSHADRSAKKRAPYLALAIKSVSLACMTGTLMETPRAATPASAFSADASCAALPTDVLRVACDKCGRDVDLGPTPGSYSRH
jgi:hypothetical protein